MCRFCFEKKYTIVWKLCGSELGKISVWKPIKLSQSLTPEIVFWTGAALLLKGVVIEVYGYSQLKTEIKKL